MNVITEAKKMILDSGWIQGDYGTGDNGYCVIGALLEASPSYEEFAEAQKKVKDALRQAGYVTMVPAWNDAKGRTLEQVLKVLDSAAARV